MVGCENVGSENNRLCKITVAMWVNASVALKWVLDEPNVERALFLRKEHETLQITELLPPDTFEIEIAHVPAKGFRRGMLTRDEADSYLADIMTSLPELVSSRALLPRAFQLAQETRTGVYDALYIALGESQQIPVVTADARMAKLPFHIILIEDLPMPPTERLPRS